MAANVLKTFSSDVYLSFSESTARIRTAIFSKGVTGVAAGQSRSILLFAPVEVESF